MLKLAIPQEYIAELSRRIDITELVRSYVQLKRSGRMEKGLCPFHNEKTPSFYVYPDTNSFYCFGCGAGGDSIAFMKQIANLDYVEAIKSLASRAGMPLPDEDDGAARLRGRILQINREAARWFAQTLNSERGRDARIYLRKRGLSDSIIRRFGLGYAPDSWDALRLHLQSLGFSQEDMLTADLCRKGERQNSVYVSFRERIMFPIIDLRGGVIAFGGRLLGEGRGAKYLNSSDTPVFKKSRNLFALNIAKKNTDKRIILTEGYMDVISLHQAAFTSAVAGLGTSMTAEQARLIQNYAEEVVLCFDSDEAGKKATARAIEIFKSTTLKVRVLQISDAKDPDEFIKKFGSARFEELLCGSANTIEYKLEHAKQGIDTTSESGRAAYIRAALEVLASEATPAEQDIYAGRISQQTDVDKARVMLQLEGVVRARNKRRAKEREKNLLKGSAAETLSKSIPYTSGGKTAVGIAHAEQQLVAAILKDPQEFLPVIAQKITPEQMISPDMAEAYTQILSMKSHPEHIELATLSALLPEKTLALLSRVLAQNHDIGFSAQDVELFIQRIIEGAEHSQNKGEMSELELQEYFEKKRDAKL